MMKLLIVNADDFGLSPGVNYGIIEAHRHGLVTSTTAMMNAGGIEHAAEISADYPLLGVGLHFVLSYGRPLSAMPSLVREGHLGKWVWEVAKQGSLADEDIVAELHQQFDRFVSLFGRQPTHIDSHHHVHFVPQVWQHVSDFARKKGVPVRLDWQAIRQQNIPVQGVRGVERFINDFYAENVSDRFVLEALRRATLGDEQSVELMCHPAFIDKTGMASSYCFPRLDELEVLTSPALQRAVVELGFRLGTYRDL